MKASYLLLVLFLSAGITLAQEPTDSLAPQRWSELRQELVYKKKTARPERVQFARVETPDWVTGILYASFFIAIGLIVYFVFRHAWQQPDTQLGDRVEAQLDTEDIGKVNLNRLLEEALKDENYRLAVRIYYLIILQKLSASELIRWKKDYTNRHYLRDMRNHPLSKRFAAATHSFEQVWYGNHIPGREGFTELQRQFDALLADIPQKPATSSQNPATSDP